MSIFENKTPMPDKANVRVAEPKWRYPGEPIAVSMKPPDAVIERSDAPVRVSQTLQERYTDRADDAMSVVNLMRPRRGHAY
jgi:hypothetical protein